jgi:hypothetical protein
LTQKVPEHHICHPAALSGGGWIGQAGGCAARRQGVGIGCAPLPGRWGKAGGALSPKAPREVRPAWISEPYRGNAESGDTADWVAAQVGAALRGRLGILRGWMPERLDGARS